MKDGGKSMTDLLKAAIIKAEKEEDIEISDQLMIDWLDSLIEMQNRINQLELQNALAGVVRYPNGYTYSAGSNPFCGCGCNM